MSNIKGTWIQPELVARVNPFAVGGIFASTPTGIAPLKMEATRSMASTPVVHAAAQEQGDDTYPIHAECQVGANGKVCGGAPEQAEGCNGLVRFTQTSAEETIISWALAKCGKEGPHGFHIHEKADFSNGCMSAGPHYNPHGVTHGGQDGDKTQRHAGDLGNVAMDGKGSSVGQLTDHLVKLAGPHTVIGRSVMVHADPDDLGCGDNSKAKEPGPPQNGFVSKVTGNAGARIACGEIKRCAAPSNAEA